MDFFDTILRWGPLGLMMTNLIAYFGMWIVTRTLVSKEDVAQIELRLGLLEQAHHESPGWVTLNEIRGGLAKIDGDLKALGASFTSLHESHGNLSRQIETINQHLLDRERS